MTLKGAWAFARDGQRYTFAAISRFETDDMATAHAAIRSGLALGVLPLYIAADDLRLGRLVPLLPDYQLVPEADIYLVHLPNLTLPLRVRALIDFLEHRFKPTPPWEQGSPIPPATAPGLT
jgi:DNA-binding transcriptional LysR family regulator